LRAHHNCYRHNHLHTFRTLQAMIITVVSVGIKPGTWIPSLKEKERPQKGRSGTQAALNRPC